MLTFIERIDKNMFKKIKGTQDFLDLTLFNFVINQAKKHLSCYRFTEIATPIIEPLDMYKRSTGEETEVVSKQMFTIQQRKDEDQICLRPEATPSIIRAFVENKVQQMPWKVYTWGPMFRYERPQKGRYRQFHQFNMEIIGSQSVSQDAHFIKMLDRFFHDKLQFNNYALFINYLGCPEDRRLFLIMLDKFLDGFVDQLCAECKIRKEKNILRVFDCKNPQCQKFYVQAPKITDNLCDNCSEEWSDLREQLTLLSVSFSVQSKLVRGLDYYSKTVFVFDSPSLGSQSEFCGGGRYNELISQLGGKKDQPSIGAAMGIDRILLLLDADKDKLPLPQESALSIVLPIEREQQTLALLVADNLQHAGICADVLLEGDSIKSMMRKANKIGAKYVLIIGPDEQKEKMVMVKNMVNGSSEKILQVDLVDYLKD